MSEMSLTHVSESIYTIDSHVVMAGIRLPVRTTIIRLLDNSLAVYAPGAFIARQRSPLC